MKHVMISVSLVVGTLLNGSFASAQMGVGISHPKAKLHVYDGTFLSQTPQLDPQTSPFYNPDLFDVDPVLHTFKWISEKGAFRALGLVTFNQNIYTASAGKFSFTSGFDNYATGIATSAMGMRASATDIAAFAVGWSAIANGKRAFVFGESSSANGLNSVTLGTNLEDNYLTGTFIFGNIEGNLQNTDNNQIMMLFQGGYRFFTSADLTTGVYMGPGASSWSILSDVRKKENFAPVDGKEFLQSIKKMPITSWNYKGQNAANMRHYGPMAQDFFKAFGKDSYGTIGADTTINQADLDGVTLIAIQALVKETDDLQKMNDDLETELVRLRAQLLGRRDFRHPARRTLLARRKN